MKEPSGVEAKEFGLTDPLDLLLLLQVRGERLFWFS